MELQNAWDIQLANKQYTLTHRLNNPNELKNEGPARSGDYDPNVVHPVCKCLQVKVCNDNNNK